MTLEMFDSEVHNLTLEELRCDEGERLRVYDDATGKPIGPGTLVKGNPTIGIGRNLCGNGISAAESLAMVINDMESSYTELAQALPWFEALSPRRKAALMCLYFNLDLHSIGKFKASWPHLLQQLSDAQWAQAADNLERTQPWVSEVGHGRSQRLGEMLRFG